MQPRNENGQELEVLVLHYMTNGFCHVRCSLVLAGANWGTAAFLLKVLSPFFGACSWSDAYWFACFAQHCKRAIMRSSFLFIATLFILQACGRSNVDENKEVIRFFMEEVLGENKLDLYHDYHTPEFKGHSGKMTFTLEQDYEAAVDNRKGIPDFTVRVTRLVAEDDIVVAHWSATGTNTGTNSYLQVASGKKLEAEGITIFRIQHGKISEEWGLTNLFQVLYQQGLLAGG